VAIGGAVGLKTVDANFRRSCRMVFGQVSGGPGNAPQVQRFRWFVRRLPGPSLSLC
jgi:hypothetical protein